MSDQLTHGPKSDFQFPGYEILERIGAGGMADVYLAVDPNGARVVLKVPHREYSSDTGFIRRLKSEKDALCRLNHPCIAMFKDFHEDADPPVLVVEYIEGPTLAQILQDDSAPWPADRACHILSQIAEALDYCHRASVTHRDIKPANILITGKDHVKVADFGIARLRDAAPLTEVSMIVGSALVMAPEQWEKKPLGPPVDIYALGVLAYRLLTGQYPFEGDVESVREGHLSRYPVQPRTLNPDLPPALSDMVMECLNKDPGRRLSSADEFVQRINKIRPTLDFYARYRMEEEIGRGAMGVVFRATRREDGMTVAIKTLDQRLTDPILISRLRSEAAVLARLNHSFICQLIEARDSFLVMQYIRGQTLGDRIRKSDGLPVPEAIRYFKDILQALAAAHDANVIHRDLKPSNIMVRDAPIQDHAIVMDFGIAKLLGSTAASRTAEGMGAAPYKAPELWKRESPDARSDIYSLGTILFEMITNKLPFMGGDPGDFERQHLGITPASLPPEVDREFPGLNAFIMRCLEKDPKKRFQTVNTMYRALEKIEQGAPGRDQNQTVSLPASGSGSLPAPVRTRTGKRMGAVWITTAVLATAGLIFGWQWFGARNDRDPGTTTPATSVTNPKQPEGASPAPPLVRLTRDRFSMSRGEVVAIPVTVSGDHQTGRLEVRPAEGTRIVREDVNRFSVEFTATPGIRSPHRLWVIASGRGGRDSQSVMIMIAAPPAPQLHVRERYRIRTGERLRVPVRVTPLDAGDSTLRLSVLPDRGVTLRQTGPVAFDLFFTPYDGSPNPYELTVTAEGAGGRQSRVVTVEILPAAPPPVTTRRLTLSIRPPARVLVDGRIVTPRAVDAYELTLGADIPKVAVMHADYPIAPVDIPPGDGPIDVTIDIQKLFGSADKAELRVNVVGGNTAVDRNDLIRVNAASFPCELTHRCYFKAGRFLITVADAAGRVSGIKFNGRNVPPSTRVFQLLSPAEGRRYNTLVFYVE